MKLIDSDEILTSIPVCKNIASLVIESNIPSTSSAAYCTLH